MEKTEKKSKDRSVVAIVAGYFTVQWLVQTVTAWGVSMWLTKLWNNRKNSQNK